jgi:hypothetical protein
MDIDHNIRVEMFSNVAVIETELKGNAGSRNVVLPVGTPIIDSGVGHHVSQLLFWYDQERGGRQSFRIFEVVRGAQEEVVLRRLEDGTTTVMGEPTEVESYALEWSTHTVQFYIDKTGRLVGVDMGYLRLELVEWSSEQPEDEGGS